MKRILLILLLGITAFTAKSQTTGPIRINKYLVDSSDGSFFRLYHDSTRLGAWGLVGSGSGGGGSITLAGQNYLSLAGSVLTANAVNLSGGNVTGTLAAARVPAFTGVIQNTAGSLTTSFVAGSIVNADVNASAAIDASKLNLLSLETHTSGSTVTVTSQTKDIWFFVDPASILAALTITMPATPVNGQTVTISFGGTMTTGTVVTALTVSPNTGQTLLQATTPSSVEAGEAITYKYKLSNTKWYRL